VSGKRRCTKAERDRATGIAAFAAAVLVFLAGRRSNSEAATPPVKETPPAPAPAEKTGLEKFFHWLTWPVRKKDQDKRQLEETPPEVPEPPKDTSKTVSVCGITLTCGEATDTTADTAEKPEEKAEGSEGLMGIVLKVLGAVATGIGIVGFVTVVGAAIFWTRFDAIGLPATQAVSVIPKAELLVQGTQEVILFVGIGLASALLIALVDRKGMVTPGTVIVLCLFVLIAGAYVTLKSLPLLWTQGLVLLTIVLALLCVAIAFNTEQRLMPLLVSVFLASLIFSSSCALLIVEDQKYAQAIAIRFGLDADGVDKGLTGIYVTATGDTLYFARTGIDQDLKKNPGDTTGLYEVHRADTTTYAVGPLEPTEGPGESNPVQDQAKRLLRRLNKDGKSFLPVETSGDESGDEEQATGTTTGK
jgi:hypothetical protein